MACPRECTVCGGAKFEAHFKGLIRCQKCLHVFADLSISDADLSEIYSKSYFFGEEYANYTADEPALRKNFDHRLQLLNRYTNPSIHKKLLEIGCAYGFFLDEARRFYQDCLGIDINSDGIRYAKETFQLNVEHINFLDLELPKAVYVGCMWDTIEHLKDPHLYIEHFAQAAEPGSLLAITTGNIDSLVARLRKEKWRLIHPPSHIHYFSMRTLGHLLQRYGFEVVHASHVGFQRSMDMVLYRILVLNAGKKGLYDLIPQVLKRRFFYLNLFDIMYVVARRI
jgi:2-polyprenyl-3-methyl-5-hydroxy-6-metoxy-1,4-benzoquinol methylase